MTRLAERGAFSFALGVALVLLVLAAVLAAPGAAVHAQGIGDSLDFSLATGNGNATGITWDGTYLRIVDSDDYEVYTYTSSGTHVSGQDFGLTGANTSAGGITWDGTYLRIVDEVDDQVYTYTSSGTHVSEQDFDLADDNTNARGITWDGTYLRIVDYVDHQVYTYTSSGTHVSGQDFDLTSDNADTYGITWDGTYLRILDSDDDQVYTYTSSGTHVNGHDFDLTSDNADPTGITWDGTYLRIVDRVDDKVYTYDVHRAYGTTLGAPSAPDLVQANRNADYDEVTITWELDDPALLYEIQRLEATTVAVGEQTRIEYGNSQIFEVEGTFPGVSEYLDTTADPSTTYQYRVRGRGADAGDWSAYAFSGAEPRAYQLDAPSNVAVLRGSGNEEATVTWMAPDGDVDGYYLQREELIEVDGSSFFSERMTFPETTALGSTVTTYTDDEILPGRVYQYRVAAVQDDVVGEYSEWARTAAINTSLGDAPSGFRFEETMDRKLDDRREYWLSWDAVAGAEDYEVEVVSSTADGPEYTTGLVTDTTYFVTAYGRTQARVRGRMADDDLCGAQAGDYCYTEWTQYYGVQFSPAFVARVMPTPVPDATLDEFQDDVDELVDSTLDELGTDVDPSLAVQFFSLVGAATLGIISVTAGWLRGMRELGVGMAFSAGIMTLYLAEQLLGIPAAWPIGAQVLIVLPGIVAFARQLGAFR